VKETDIFSGSGTDPVQVHLLIECGFVNEVQPSIKPKKQSRYAMSIAVILTLTSDLDLIDFRRIPSVIFLSMLTASDAYRRISQDSSLDRREIFRGDS
jgi:ATP-dependent DNA helicase HFM1/MER3